MFTSVGVGPRHEGSPWDANHRTFDGATHHRWTRLRPLQVDEERGRRQTDTDEDLQGEPRDQIGIDAEAHSGSEEGDPFLPFSIDEIRHSEDACENPDEQSRGGWHTSFSHGYGDTVGREIASFRSAWLHFLPAFVGWPPQSST
jgi:hypothetical protein